MAGCCSVWCLLKWTVLLIIGVWLTHYWLQNKSYLIDEQDVVEICQKHVAVPGLNVTQLYGRIHADLSRRYPGHILPAADLEWVFLNSGGWMTAVCPLHGSMTEYILFIGTAIESTGHHSGRFWANLTDVVLTGEFSAWEAGKHEARVYTPGEVFDHRWGEARGVRFAAGTWMVEYGRGMIPSTLNVAMADVIFCTQDYYTLYNLMRLFGKTMLLEMGTSLASLF